MEIRLLFTGRSDDTSVQLFRYTIVGGTSFVVDFATLYLLTETGNIHYALSAAISFLFGLLTNYLLSKVWVFTTSSVRSRMVEFFLFALIGIIGLGINEMVMIAFTEIFAIYYLGSKIISAIVVYLWNFFARKYLLFR